MSSTTQIDSLDPETTALMIVDVQKGFTSEEGVPAQSGLDVSMAAETIPDVVDLIDLARANDLVIAYSRSARDAKGRDSPQQLYDVLPAAYRSGAPTCCEGTVDVEYAEGIEPRDEEYEVKKQRYNAFRETPLETYFRAEGISTLLFCGFMTNVCVESTARGAHERGFDTVLVRDCAASNAEEMHQCSIRNFETVLGDTITKEEVEPLLRQDGVVAQD